MKRRLVAVLFCGVLIMWGLFGCSKQEVGPGAMGSETWIKMPALTYGVLESNPLEVLSWNNGRAEATSRNRFAETENGYYFIYGMYLYYADKASLNNWLLVCNRPDCNHWDIECNACLGAVSFIVSKDKIIFSSHSDQYPNLYPYNGSGHMLISMAADGTEKQCAYAIDIPVSTGSGRKSSVLTSSHWLYYAEYLDSNGEKVRCLYRAANTGVQQIPLNPDYEGDAYLAGSLYGDDAFSCGALGSSEYGCFRFVNDKVTEIEIFGLDTARAYLSGNVLRCFRKNDGYYDIDVTTREEVFLADPRMEDSLAVVVLPNCIIESTLFDTTGWSKEENHKMELFDGEKWRVVELPEELKCSGNAYTLNSFSFSVTSDGIFFNCREGENFANVKLYRIPLTDGELTAEYCCDIKMPTQENAKAAQ